jgi:hypothetical protein
MRDVMQRIDLEQADELRAACRNEARAAREEESKDSDDEVHDAEYDAQQAVR